MTLADSARIGIGDEPRSASIARIAWVASTPFITGICTSIRIRSKGSALNASTASRPFFVTRTSRPNGSSMAVSRS